MAKTAIKGATHLFIGKIVSRVVGVLGGLILIRLLMPEDYGLISIAMVVPGLLGLFGSLFGISTAIIKHLAEYKSKGDVGTIKIFAYISFVFSVGISVVLTIVCYLLANNFSSAVLGKPYIDHLVRVASFSILTSALYFYSESVLIGPDETRFYAMLMILYEFLLKVLPIALVICGFEVWGALFGMVLAGFITGLAGSVVSISLVARLGKEKPSLDSKAA
ncbi:MAG: oligosaccharide flippase family protein, partial [Candidatus Bathyarchaeia archaeon]